MGLKKKEMKKFLKYIFVIQEVSNKNRKVKLGRGFSTSLRFNPYNPLSYMFLILIPFVAILMFGFVGVWKEIEFSNPFKWN